MTDAMIPEFSSLSIRISQRIAILSLNRPKQSNAFNDSLWTEFTQAMHYLDQSEDINVVVIKGQGRNFCAGIDLETLGSVAKLMEAEDPARGSAAFRRKILGLQESFNAIEACRWPCIAAVHGACVGAGVDLIAAADCRICSTDASFCVKEVDLAITADLGSLQRLPHLIGYGQTMELALTARTFSAAEARAMGLVTEVCEKKEALDARAMQLAGLIACKSPLAVTGTKRVLQHARDRPVQEGLEYVATWNSSQALSHDLREVMAARQQRRRPHSFSKL